MDRGYYDNQFFLDGGWVDGLKYEDEVLDLLNVRLHPHPTPLLLTASRVPIPDPYT